MSATTKPSLAGNGRKAGSAALMAVVAAGIVQALLANPETVPAAEADPTIPTTAVEAAAEPAASTTAGNSTPSTAPAASTAGPVEVAAGWYATRHKLPADHVTGLQADQLSKNKVRVLVLVDHGKGRLDSAVVTVTRGKAGWKASR